MLAETEADEELSVTNSHIVFVFACISSRAKGVTVLGEHCLLSASQEAVLTGMESEWAQGFSS